MSIIELENVSKSFKGVMIFESIKLNIDKGKIYGFVGSNGSGKSVLFKMICGFIFPEEGTIFVNNQEIGNSKNRFPKNVGIILESPGYIANKSGFENLKDLSLIRNKISDSTIKKTMEIVGLNSDSKQKVKNYSLGMKQKLAIVQAIMEDQEILILDEPFNALDENSVTKTRNLLRSLKAEGKTILLTSHNNDDINSLCDYVFRINNKKIEQVYEGKVVNTN
ncbi:multidrug ABC transporter ATP-binding protein [Sporosarcina ureae]|uniref:ABC transporter ATP-binding protein n=1 Tax=Sporosarcina ureae TaxID=1571 RepID=UPI000A1541CD|nr:ATP-binding cassette domain-containing protein [Sporosarcina ureae]ARJ37747.1 multidrug ABC transporter ATP-binding protein [Sporosarcina ureae]